MLTIRHISLSAEETIFEVSSVRFSPGTPRTTELSETPDTLWVASKQNTIGSGIEEIPLTGGNIFVMNEAGKTVARYDLGASQAPLEVTK